LTERVVVKVVGLPGEDVSIRGGALRVNGRELAVRPYLSRPGSRTTPAASLPAQTIPAGQYLLLGDGNNPPCDSRYFGPVPASFILRPSLPRLVRIPAFRQGYEICADLGRVELGALYDATTEKAIAVDVSADQPSAKKRKIQAGCLAGLSRHRLGQRRAPVPKGGYGEEEDEDEGG